MEEGEFIDNIGKQVSSSFDQNIPKGDYDETESIKSDNYEDFKQEQKDEFSFNTFFEKFCNFSSKYVGGSVSIFKLFDKEIEKEIKEDIEISGVVATPKGVISSSVMVIIIGLIFSFPFVIFNSLNFMIFIVMTGFAMSIILFTYPAYLSQIVKIQAQQESLLAILYMTIYMRVNPIMENAIFFAAEHLDGPLGRDLKQILWLLDNEKVANVEEAIQYFIPLWVKRNQDFVKSILILHSVLRQGDKENQAKIMDKSLDLILSSTYEKMKHFSHDLQMPVTLLHTFGMMLPLIGLIAFPMVSIFMSDKVNISWLFFWIHCCSSSNNLFFYKKDNCKKTWCFFYT